MNAIRIINNHTRQTVNLATKCLESVSEHGFTLIIGLSIAFAYCW